MSVDFRIEDHGSIVVVQPLTPQAGEWIEENVPTEPWQWLGGGLCVEHRYAEPLIEGIVEDGLSLAFGVRLRTPKVNA
jgi:hypothetical protein